MYHEHQKAMLESNSKKFSHIGFCGPEISTKFWYFAAGMDFDTPQILNLML